MKNFHRIVFYAGFIERLYFILATSGMSPSEYEEFVSGSRTITGLFALYFIGMGLYSLVDLFKNKRKKKILWIPFILLVWYVGVYVYFELHLFKKSSQPTGEQKQDIREEIKAFALSASIPVLMRKRAFAALIDYSLWSSLFALYVLLFGERYGGTLQILGLHHFMVLLAGWIAFFSLAEALYGKTIGKKLAGVVVINRWGARPSFTQTLVRHLMDILDFLVFTFIVVVKYKDSTIPRRLGDRLANTWVMPDSFLATLDPR